MKGILFLIICTICLTTISCKKDKDNHIYLRFINETGTEITDAIAGGKLLENLSIGATSSEISFDELYYIADYPIFDFTAKFNGQSLDRLPLTFRDPPIPSKELVPPGHYDVLIKIITSPAKNYCRVTFK